MKDEVKRLRKSPGSSQRYPFISLPRAIERARELYKVADAYEVQTSVAVKVWNFSEKSSGGGMTIAALKSFGLLVDSGKNESRKVKLTDMALKIIKDPREISPERDALLKVAALKPPIHSEIIEYYNGLPPSDQAFKAYLLLDKGFREEAAHDFIKEFTATMDYAKITNFDKVHDVAEMESLQENIIRTTLSAPDSPKPLVNASFPDTSTTSKLSEPCEINDIKVLLDGEYVRVSAYVDYNGLRRLLKRLEANLKILEDELLEDV